MIGPARQQAAQDPGRGALAARHAAGNADDIGDLVIVAAEKVLGDREQVLAGRDIQVQQPRQWQVDGHDLIQVDAVVHAAQFLNLGRRQRQRGISAKFRPFGSREYAIGRKL